MMKTSVHLDFIIELQSGNYDSLESNLNDLVRSIENKLSGEYNYIVSSVSHADFGITVSPD
jgi:hypothetical protein